jgi:putative nucleotidyltransferase with HDIG domain
MKENEFRSKIYSKIDELPTLPVVLPKLLSLIESDSANFSRATDVIYSDPSLTSKILKVANSAYYGFSQQITTLKSAVALLGFSMVKSLALSMGVFQTMPLSGKDNHFSQKGLWIHSLAVATTMTELDKRIGKKDGSEHVFVTGLLHDIGKIVLDHFFNDIFQQVLDETHEAKGEEFHEIERRIIGFDHGEIGAMLLERWKFPEVICNAVALHHKRELPEGRASIDVALLRIADVIPQELGLGEEDNLRPSKIEEDLKLLNIDRSDLENVKTCLNSAKEGIYAMFDAMN